MIKKCLRLPRRQNSMAYGEGEIIYARPGVILEILIFCCLRYQNTPIAIPGRRNR